MKLGEIRGWRLQRNANLLNTNCVRPSRDTNVAEYRWSWRSLKNTNQSNNRIPAPECRCDSRILLAWSWFQLIFTCRWPTYWQVTSAKKRIQTRVHYLTPEYLVDTVKLGWRVTNLTPLKNRPWFYVFDVENYVKDVRKFIKWKSTRRPTLHDDVR